MPKQERPVSITCATESVGVLSKLRLAVKRPGELFSLISKEPGYECHVRFFLFLLVIQTVVGNLTMLFIPGRITGCLTCSAINPLLGAIIMASLRDIILINISVALSILFTFIIASVLHAFVRAVRGRGGLEGTFKTVVYSYAPNMLLTVAIAVFLGFAAVASALLPIQVTGIVFLIVPLFSVPFLIWSLYLGVRGLSSLHNISIIKSFIAIAVTAGAMWAFISALSLTGVSLL